MGREEMNEVRARVVADASGVVVEIGFGSGYNLPFYKNVTKFYALEPSAELFALGRERIEQSAFPVQHLQGGAEAISLPDNSVDTVVSTWTLCSVAHPEQVMREIYRVLVPGGKFIFFEHGLSSKELHAKVQKFVTPVRRHFTGNCHADRAIDTLIASAGFTVQNLKKFSPEEGSLLLFYYDGVAVKK